MPDTNPVTTPGFPSDDQPKLRRQAHQQPNGDVPTIQPVGPPTAAPKPATNPFGHSTQASNPFPTSHDNPVTVPGFPSNPQPSFPPVSNPVGVGGWPTGTVPGNPQPHQNIVNRYGWNPNSNSFQRADEWFAKNNPLMRELFRRAFFTGQF